MKKHLSSIVFGCLGLCAGFTICYVVLVIPTHEAKPTAFTSGPRMVFYAPRDGHSQLDWRPQIIQPMLPPNIIGRYDYKSK